MSPLAVVHTLGNTLTNVSLGAVAVSFTHTIKALEPLFSVALSALFMGDAPSGAVLATLFPIIGGVALASTSELSFNWTGFLSAMGSNLTFQSRNVLSKRFMAGGKPALDNINLFSVITILSFVILAPVALALEGAPLSHAALIAHGVADPRLLLQRAILAGLCFHAYQQVSYMILQRVSPVTHSIGNCVKRVVVIIASVFVFRNPVTPQNALGALQGGVGAVPGSCIAWDGGVTLGERGIQAGGPTHHPARGLRRALKDHMQHQYPVVIQKPAVPLPAGTAIALAGVFGYSQVKRLGGKGKVKKA